MLGMTSKTWTSVASVVATIGTVTSLMWVLMDRVHQGDVARLKSEADGNAARLEDKIENYRFFVQALGTRDHEPLKEALSQQQTSIRKMSQAIATGGSGGEEGDKKKPGRGEDCGAGS